MARPIIVRSPLPGTPAQVFQLVTDGTQLARWFCDACEAEPRLGGDIHAAWIDEEGETWERVGVWEEYDAPYRATLRWYATEEGAEPEDLKFAVAPHPLGAMLTVISPPPQSEVALRPEVLEDAAQQGWHQCFQALEALLVADQAATGSAPTK